MRSRHVATATVTAIAIAATAISSCGGPPVDPPLTFNALPMCGAESCKWEHSPVVLTARSTAKIYTVAAFVDGANYVNAMAGCEVFSWGVGSTFEIGDGEHMTGGGTAYWEHDGRHITKAWAVIHGGNITRDMVTTAAHELLHGLMFQHVPDTDKTVMNPIIQYNPMINEQQLAALRGAYCGGVS